MNKLLYLVICILLVSIAFAKTPMIGDSIHVVMNDQNHYRGIVEGCDNGLLCMNCSSFPVQNTSMSFGAYSKNETGEYWNVGDGWFKQPAYKNFCLGTNNINVIDWQ